MRWRDKLVDGQGDCNNLLGSDLEGNVAQLSSFKVEIKSSM